MAAKTDKVETPVAQAEKNKSKFHFMLRSVIRTAMTVPQSGARTSEEFDAEVSEWVNSGWKVFSSEVVGFDEQVFTVAVMLIQE